MDKTKPAQPPDSSKSDDISGANTAEAESNNSLPVSNDGGELIVIESISGCSSENGDIEEEDVEVLQLRREALEAMVKKLDESHSQVRESGLEEKEENSANSVKTQECDIIIIDDSEDCQTPAPVSAESNLDIDEKSLREKLLKDISQKRNLNPNGSERESTPKLPSTSNMLVPVGKSLPKHSPIKFPGGVINPQKSSATVGNVAFSAKHKQTFDLRYTLQNKANANALAQSHPQAVPFVSLQSRHSVPPHSITIPKSTKYSKSRNRVFNKHMENLTITIPNLTKKVIIPLDVPTTDDEGESQSSPEALSKETNNTIEDSIKEGHPNRSGQEATPPPSLNNSVLQPKNNSPAIDPKQLPESFQLKLAKLLKDAKEDFHRSVEMDNEEQEKRKKEIEIRDLQERARRLEEEEEVLRKAKEHLAYLKAERRRRLLTKATGPQSTKPSGSPKSTISSKTASPPKAKSPNNVNYSASSSLAAPTSTNSLNITNSTTVTYLKVSDSPTNLTNSPKSTMSKHSSTSPSKTPSTHLAFDTKSSFQVTLLFSFTSNSVTRCFYNTVWRNYNRT
jgi:hypothetical protein